MSRYDNLVHSKEAMIRLLSAVVFGLFLLLALSLHGWSRAPDDIRLHYPPDLSRGAVHRLGDVPKISVYTFAYYIFQQLNRWPVDGTEDYYNKIHQLRAYLTPACFEDRLSDWDQRQNAIAGRQRAIWEIPSRGFHNDRVVVHSATSWRVGLDLHVEETYRGEHVKDRVIHYPLRVVVYDVDPESNPWGLALDCFASQPSPIEMHRMEIES